MSIATLENIATTTATPIVLRGTLGDMITAVKTATSAIGTRPPVPVLSFVKFTVSTLGAVSVSGFDYEKYASRQLVSGTSDTPGEFLVMGSMLKKILEASGKRATKRITDEWPVAVTVEGSKVVVNVNGQDNHLMMGPLEDYPDMPVVLGSRIDPNSDALIQTPALIELMDRAVIAASADDTLPVLTGVQLNVEGGQLEALSTDRYRLAQVKAAVIAAPDTDFTVLLNGKTWKSFKRSLDKSEPTLLSLHGAHGATVSPKWVGLANGHTFMAALEFDGQYPKIRTLFPDQTPMEFDVDADTLHGAVAAVSVTAERNTPIRLDFMAGGKLVLDAGTGEDAQSNMTIGWAGFRDCDPITVAFNPHYLMEGLKAFKGQRVAFRFTSAPKPAMLQAINENGEHLDGFKYLVMPVRLPQQ